MFKEGPAFFDTHLGRLAQDPKILFTKQAELFLDLTQIVVGREESEVVARVTQSERGKNLGDFVVGLGPLSVGRGNVRMNEEPEILRWEWRG